MPARKFFTLIMSMTGMPSVMATIISTPASAASMMASAANGGGTKIMLQLAPVALTASLTVLKHRHLIHFLPALSRRDACHDLCAVGHALTGMKLPFLAGDSLNQKPGVFIYKYAHGVSS